MNLTKIETPKIIESKLSATIPGYVIRQRDAGRGQVLDYISGATVIDILNATFGPMGWNFEAIKEWKEQSEPFFQKKSKWFIPDPSIVTKNDKGEEGAWLPQAPVAWVKGRLTVFLKDEKDSTLEIHKEAYGSKSITGKQSEQEHIFKSAQTDALKKAASLLGIGTQLYRNEEEQRYFETVNKPLVWTAETLAGNETWKKIIGIASDNGWNEKEINYYVSEITDGEYVDIYTLPEIWFETLLGTLMSVLQQ